MPRPQDLLRDWLAAERAGGDEAAESLLAELFARLPEAAPRPGFAARVVAAARSAEHPARSPALGWGLRLLTASCLLATGLIGAVVSTLAAGRPLPGLAGVLTLVAHGFAAFGERLAALLSVVRYLGGLADTLLAALTAPQVSAALLALAAGAALGGRWLSWLLAPERRASYVEAH